MSPALAAEVSQPPNWMYEWDLGRGISTPLAQNELGSIHVTRLDLLAPAVQDAIAAAGDGATVIDLACNEGWFSHRMLDWGADRVLGVDIRAQMIRRAELVRDHLGVPAERLEFRHADVFDLRPSDLGRYDVVLCLGLVYHLENPVGALRIARALTSRLCAIESQLTRQSDPIVHGWGTTDAFEEAAASFAVRLEEDQEANMLASSGGVVSLVPNRAALALSARAAGFGEVEFLDVDPASGHNRQYVTGDRAVMLARP
jgi:hypothetical protein